MSVSEGVTQELALRASESKAYSNELAGSEHAPGARLCPAGYLFQTYPMRCEQKHDSHAGAKSVQLTDYEPPDPRDVR